MAHSFFMQKKAVSLKDKNQAAVDAHLKAPWFQAIVKTFEEENLLASPLEIKHVTPFAGFKSR
jgi:hypothetical protein